MASDTHSVYSQLNAYYATSLLSVVTDNTSLRGSVDLTTAQLAIAYRYPGVVPYSESTTALLHKHTEMPRGTPSFTSQFQFQESMQHYDFFLNNDELRGHKNEQPGWALLRIANPRHSSSSGYRKPQHPTFLTGDKISATVFLKLDKKPKITAVHMQVVGRVVPKLHNAWQTHAYHTILNHRHTLWLPVGDKGELDTKKDHEINFEVDFPTELDLWAICGGASRKGSETPVLVVSPPSMKDSKVTIEYRVELVIEHGRFRTASIVSAPLLYVLKSTPPALSGMRRLAYLDGNPAPPPSADSEGWLAQGPAQITLEGNIKAMYTLFIAQPLFYTCGTAIPCHVTITCDEKPRDLDAFISPEGQHVKLVRRIAVLEDPGVTLGRELSRLTAIGTNLPDTSYIGDSTANWKFIEDVVESCIFWRPMDDDPESATSPGQYVHQLAGEIHLDKGLIPSFNAVIFSVEYMIQAFRHRPVEPANLSPVNLGTLSQGKSSFSPTQAPLISIPVNIGTMRPPGPRHIFVTSPPAASKKRVTVNFGGWMP